MFCSGGGFSGTGSFVGSNTTMLLFCSSLTISSRSLLWSPHNQIANVDFLALDQWFLAASIKPVALVCCSMLRSVWSVFGCQRCLFAWKGPITKGVFRGRVFVYASVQYRFGHEMELFCTISLVICMPYTYG
ncbi:hypothetical protein L195_g047180 [Trifolium pratense]|uniref:Uncharacterized protein n=1 Tax=Trifolium pratense TaxID=57577 RepID=A0A2K3MJR3_TRIPR|nr:hypothetical protein L195_g047180 [Trifolium pratense]